MPDLDLGLPPPQAAAAPSGASSNDIDLGLASPQVQPQAQSWLQYAQDPSHPYVNRLGAATVEEGQRIGSGILGAAKSAVTGDWFAPLAHQVGQETMANTASTDTAGRVANVAMATTPGDLMSPGMVGTKIGKAEAVVPTTDELYDAAGRQYDAARNLGVFYSEGGLGDLAGGIKDSLDSNGFHDIVAPQTHAVLSRLQDPRSAVPGEIAADDTVAAPLTWVDNNRRVLNKIAGGNNPTERAAATTAIRGIDGFMENPPEGAVFSGPADQAADLYRTARGNYAAAKRSDLLQGVEEGADFHANSTNSGANYDNTLRQRLRPYIDPSIKSKTLRGFSPDEQSAVADVVNGGPLRNTVRATSNLLGGGGGWGAATEGMGAAFLGNELMGPAGFAAGVAVPIAGRALKAGQNQLARNALGRADELVRTRSPLYAERQAAAPLEMSPNAPGMAAVRAIGPANNDQSQYAKGGSVKPNHDRLVARLMSLAEKAKSAEKQRTKAILTVPDNAVTMALAKANQVI